MKRAAIDFDQLVRANAPAVRRYALSLVRDPWLADDVLQETFLRVWKYWSSSQSVANPQAWVIRIARNTAFDMLARRRDVATDQLENIVSIDQYSLSLNTMQAMMRLPLEHREVVYLVDIAEFDYAMAAHILDIPSGTLRSRLHRARTALRVLLEDQTGNESARGTA